MPNVVRNDLVQRVRVRRGVPDKAFVVVDMIPAELHFRVEREMVSVFLQRLHVVTECVVRTIGLRQDVRKKAVAHADTEKPFHFGIGCIGLRLSEALQCRQKQRATCGSKYLATIHYVRPLITLGKLCPVGRNDTASNSKAKYV